MVAKRQAIPDQISFTAVAGLSVSVFVNNVLDCVNLSSTMIRADTNIFTLVALGRTYHWNFGNCSLGIFWFLSVASGWFLRLYNTSLIYNCIGSKLSNVRKINFFPTFCWRRVIWRRHIQRLLMWSLARWSVGYYLLLSNSYFRLLFSSFSLSCTTMFSRG